MKNGVHQLGLVSALICMFALTACQTTREKYDQAMTTSKVKAALLDDHMVKGTDIDVDSFNGTVQLNGYVDTAEQKQRAEQIARGVDEVRQVQNNLMVKGSTETGTGTSRGTTSGSGTQTSDDHDLDDLDVDADLDTGDDLDEFDADVDVDTDRR